MAKYHCACGVTGEENFYKNAKYQCKSCWNKRTATKQKDKIMSLKQRYGGKCIKCGYDKCLEALVFHHRNPSEKEFNLGDKRGYNEQRLMEELNKCDLLCSNCHIEIHSGDYHGELIKNGLR